MKTKPAPILREPHAIGVRIIPVTVMPPLAAEVVPIFRRFRLRRRQAFEYHRGALCLSVPLNGWLPVPVDRRKPVLGEFRRVYDLALAAEPAGPKTGRPRG